MLTTTSYKQAFISRLQHLEPPATMIHSIKAYGTRFAKWCFGTLHQELSEAEAALKFGWQHTEFKFKDSDMGKKVDDAITHAHFWKWLTIMLHISQYVFTQRRWAAAWSHCQILDPLRGVVVSHLNCGNPERQKHTNEFIRRMSETPTTTTSPKSITIHLPFVLQYASNLYCSTFGAPRL